MATIQFNLSSPEAIQRFHDLAETVMDMHGGCGSQTLWALKKG